MPPHNTTQQSTPPNTTIHHAATVTIRPPSHPAHQHHTISPRQPQRPSSPVSPPNPPEAASTKPLTMGGRWREIRAGCNGGHTVTAVRTTRHNNPPRGTQQSTPQQPSPHDRHLIQPDTTALSPPVTTQPRSLIPQLLTNHCREQIISDLKRLRKNKNKS
jgi:hypothetical protein